MVYTYLSIRGSLHTSLSKWNIQNIHNHKEKMSKCLVCNIKTDTSEYDIVDVETSKVNSHPKFVVIDGTV